MADVGTIDWRIERLLEKKSETKYSPRFKVGKDDCHLYIYGVNKECRECVSKTAVHLDPIYSINTYNYTFYLCLIARCGEEFFLTKRSLLRREPDTLLLTTIEDLELESNKNDFLPKGTLTLRLSWCEKQESAVCKRVTQMISDLAPEQELLETLSRDFNRFHENEINTDCVLKVGDAEFPVHRQVLSARSNVFAAMFLHDTSEKRSGVVDIPDVDAAVLKDVLYYIYSGHIRGLSAVTAASMYVVADKYSLTEFREMCLEVLKRSLTIENVCDAAVLAYMHGESELEETVVQFMTERLEEIKETDKWREMSKNKPSLAIKLLQNVVFACKDKYKK